MFYLPLALLTWLCFGWMIDRHRLPALLVYGLFGAVLATVQDRLVILYQLWEYRDVGPVATHPQIALLISLSAAPIFGMRFVQGLPGNAGAPWKRVCKFMLIAMVPELFALYSGHILYHNWWNVGYSFAAYIPIWLSFWKLRQWLHTPLPTTAQQTAPGT